MQLETRRQAPMLLAGKLDGYLSYLFVTLDGRWVRFTLLAVVSVLSIARFFHLSADFPNWSPWMQDQAKFTDEGWWACAAVRHEISGRWYTAGDYNPAAALPVWPVLLGAVFHFTGVSVVAARALSVAISIATLGVAYLLVRRYSGSDQHAPAIVGVLLLAASPFAFVFSRLAILETLVVFEFCLLMLIASYASMKRMWPLVALAAITTAMLLTKTTSALVIPAVLWIAWCAMKRNPAGLLRAVLAIAVVPAALVTTYAALVSRLGYGTDYHYFFSVNALPEFDWSQTLPALHDFFQNCFWIDRVLYPLGVAILLLTVAWKRRLWSNPLYTASWIGIFVQALFIVRRMDDYAPRYYLLMLAPLIWIAILTLSELILKARKTACILLVVVASSVIANAFMIGQFLTHRDYDFRDAANAIATIIRSHPEQPQLMLGVSGAQISLMTGIPAINDYYGTEDGAEKLKRYQPGWYLAWSGIDPDNAAMMAGYQLERVASYPAFDDDDRTTLILYKMVRRGDGATAGAAAGGK
jgi:hypothetical protein